MQKELKISPHLQEQHSSLTSTVNNKLQFRSNNLVHSRHGRRSWTGLQPEEPLDLEAHPHETCKRDTQSRHIHLFLQQRVVKAVKNHRYGHDGEEVKSILSEARRSL